MAQFNFAIIGTGARSGSLARTLMNDEEKRGDIIALCDIRPEAIERYEKAVAADLAHKAKIFAGIDFETREILINALSSVRNSQDT